MTRKQTAPHKSSARPVLFAGLLLFFAATFLFARQSIEEQQLKFRISMLSEQKMAKKDDLRVLNVEIARLEGAARIDQKVRELDLALAPAALPPIEMRTELALGPETDREGWLAYARPALEDHDLANLTDLGERDDLR